MSIDTVVCKNCNLQTPKNNKKCVHCWTKLPPPDNFEKYRQDVKNGGKGTYELAGG